MVLDEKGVALDRRQERRLENTFFREDFRRVLPGEITDIGFADGALQKYGAHATSELNLGAIRDAHPRVLVDFGFSSASMILPNLLREAHVEAITLRSGFEEAAGLWPQARNRDEELEQASAITKTVTALLGARLDPSSQRLVLIDDEGVIIDYEEATSLMALLTLRAKGPGAVVALVSGIAADGAGGCRQWWQGYLDPAWTLPRSSGPPLAARLWSPSTRRADSSGPRI